MAEEQSNRVAIQVPELGESVLEATVSRWMKKEGDRVTAGEAVVELETDKVNLEVSASSAGVIAQIERQANEDVQVGDVLGYIDPSGEAAPAAQAPDPVGERQVEERPQPAEETARPVEGTPEGAAPKEERQPAVADRATPVAQRMMVAENIGPEDIQGSGPGGKVTKEDVESYLRQKPAGKASGEAAGKPASPAAPRQEPTPAPKTVEQAQTVSTANGRAEERQRMSRRRRTIATRLVEAQQTAAILTTFNEVDMTTVMDLRKRRNEAFIERYQVKLGITSFFVKAAIGALKAFPQLNAEIQGDEMVIKHYYDIGVAVGAEEGLVVPVLHDADRMSFAAIEKKINEFATKAREGNLTLEDLRGGTFTITNGGVFGSLLSTPILMPPQVGILGLHKIEKRPIVVDDEMVIRPMMYLALSYDHRIVDGREAVQFLVRVKEFIEDPENLLLEG